MYSQVYFLTIFKSYLDNIRRAHKKKRNLICCRFQWPSGLRRGSTAARMLGLRVRIPPGTWKFVYRECCVLSGRGLCDGPITRPEESYRVWCVWLRVIEEPHRRALDCRVMKTINVLFPAVLLFLKYF